MSTTYHLECDYCKESIWIGQRNYIYTGEPETMEALKSFLFKHSGYDNNGINEIHTLFFRSSHLSKWMNGDEDWTEIKVKK